MMYLIDFGGKEPSSRELRSRIQGSVDLWENIYTHMDDEDTLWIFVEGGSALGEPRTSAMEIAQGIQERADFALRDIITVHRHIGTSSFLQHAYEEILLFAKDPEEYRFNKNRIRIEPVYKGGEWNGDRESGKSSYRQKTTKRYNPDGKDPGNVWVRENRAETESRVLDRTEPFPREEAIRRCILAGSEENEKVVTMWESDEIRSVIVECERSVAPLADEIDIAEGVE